MTAHHSMRRGNLGVSCPVPIDSELAPVLAAMYKLRPTGGLSADTLAEYRQENPGLPTPSLRELAMEGLFRIEERQIPGPSGAPDIHLLICLPEGAKRPVPAIYHTHGGGMAIGNNRSGVLDFLSNIRDLDTALVSVEYRLAPETRHPGPVEDCYAGLEWTVANAGQLNIDRDRIIAAGASAGGGLTAALALLCRDRGGPHLRAQMLLVPMLDDRNDTLSAKQLEGWGLWDRKENEFGWTSLLGSDRGGPDVSQYAAPARAEDLSGLPPAFIDVGSAETFRDEAVTYASRIWQAGGQAELHVWPGGFHGFYEIAPSVPLSQAAKEAQRSWLTRHLNV